MVNRIARETLRTKFHLEALMQRHAVRTLILGTLFALGFVPIPTLQAQTKPATSSGTSQADFKPGMDDLMTLLVQPRHTKLFFAGSHKNWELAAAEWRSLTTALAQIPQTVPTYLGNDVAAAVTSMIEPQLREVNAAIAAADAKRFTRAYADLTQACTACHTYMEHPYVVIKVPTVESDSVYADQDFSGATP
jgi:hypothetical protein